MRAYFPFNSLCSNNRKNTYLFEIKWEQLPKSFKEKHSLQKCEACYDNYYSFQQLFPEKPIYCRETVVSIDMEQATTENALTRNVLQDLITNTTTNSIDHLLTQLW